jgi:hypothetical protein
MNATAEPPETVVVFGGNAKRYHDAVEGPDGLRPRCAAAGRNPLLKERELIESHYKPCSRCFPQRVADSEEADS